MFILILDLVEDFHTVEERRLHRIFGGLEKPSKSNGSQAVSKRFYLKYSGAELLLG